MPKTRKTIQLKNLAKYDVLIEDTSLSSTYFQVTNLPPVFTGGRNSFLLAGSSALAPGSAIQIEILDAAGRTIFQNPVQKYIEGQSRLVTVEINEDTTPGFCTLIIMGRALVTPDGQPVPPDWQNSYNVRWITKILVEPQRRNSSPLILENTPSVFSEEQRLYNINSSSYTTISQPFTASLSPMLFSAFQVGYVLNAQAPTTFSADYFGGYVTGALLIDGVSASLYLPITQILNETTALTDGHLIQTTDGRTIDKLYLQSGSYQTQLLGQTANITSSATIVYSKLNTQIPNIPISYAKLRVVDLNTVSGEIFKFKVYSKVATNFSDYKLVADVYVKTSELLVSSSIRGDVPIGNFIEAPVVSTNWYADRLETSSNVVYTISGSAAYYDPTTTVDSQSLQITDHTLLRSVQADIPIYNNTGYEGYLSASGYFIGNKQALRLFPNSEYTIQLDAVYSRSSGSANLEGITPKVDIYIVGVEGDTIIDQDPLGQKVGTLAVINNEYQLYQSKQFNFRPQLADDGLVGIRFVVSNGFWYFSNISLKPASDNLFAPDEATVIIPNTEYRNDYLQHKIEFFDINNNSTDISVVSIPTFFTGSNIDLGVLP